MSESPLVSIIMATYNRAHLLPRAINSVLNQSYQNFELIIVDDGSADNTDEVVKSFEDKRIVYCKLERNKGVSAARNRGLNLARGDYITTLDDDDEFLPQALETAVNKLIKLSSEGSKSVRFDCIDAERGKLSGSGITKEGYISYEDCLCNRVQGDYWVVITMDLLGNDRFDERLGGGEGILWLKLHRKSRAYYVPQVLVKKYREHGERLCDTLNFVEHTARATLINKVFLEEYGDEIKRLCPRYYGQRLAVLGFCQILNSEKLDGRRTLLKSFKFNFSLKYGIFFLLSLILTKSQITAGYIKYINMKGVIVSPIIAVRKLLRRIKAS